MAKTMIACPVCDSRFPLKYIRKGQPKRYCSKRCRYISEWTNRSCLTCGNTFRVHRLGVKRKTVGYCSMACIQRNPCVLCGKIITGRAKILGKDKTFCSRRCANIVNRTLKGGKRNYVAVAFIGTIRRTGKLACERCGYDNLFALVGHHSDRNRDNYSTDNLITLCANCHSLEHWDGSPRRQRWASIAKFVAGLSP